MSPITHFLVGWITANTCKFDQRERALVTMAGAIPDIDGVGIVAEVLTRHSQKPLNWWSDYHHVVGHNLGFCLLVTTVGFMLARQRWKTTALVFLSFNLHLFCNDIGARGPNGHLWHIPYLLPFSNSRQWILSGQWALNAWQNFVLTGAGLAATFYLAWRRGFSPLEILSSHADHAFVSALRRRFSRRGPADGS